jgi:hypothetical protein
MRQCASPIPRAPRPTISSPTLLPERNEFDYEAAAGTLTIRTTMAGMVGMDSPYPETGAIDASTFSEKTLKLANRHRLQEAVIRRLQSLLRELRLNNQPTVPEIQRTALNFVDKIIVQAHLDATEWLRGQALATGAISWTFNKKNVSVSYGIPSGNILANRTGNDAYHGSSSKFWDDVRTIRKLLKGNVRAILAHPDTIDALRYNTANMLVTSADDGGAVTFRKQNSLGQFTDDVSDVVRIVSYGLEGEILDPANPGQTLKLPFMPRGRLVGVGNNNNNQFVVGAGSTQRPANALGYTHIAPTVENGGTPGRWAEVYTPQQEPYQLEARGASNVMPVIEDPSLIVIARTDMPS